MDYQKIILIGKIAEKPIVRESGGKKQASFTLVVNKRTQGQNGQWVDNPVNFPIFCTDKKADFIEQYTVAGQELRVECEYMTWKGADGSVKHTFVILNNFDAVGLGFKPKGSGPAKPENAGDDMPPV